MLKEDFGPWTLDVGLCLYETTLDSLLDPSVHDPNARVIRTASVVVRVHQKPVSLYCLECDDGGGQSANRAQLFHLAR